MFNWIKKLWHKDKVVNGIIPVDTWVKKHDTHKVVCISGCVVLRCDDCKDEILIPEEQWKMITSRLNERR